MPIVERERRGSDTPGYNQHPDTRAHAYQEFERYMFERIVTVDARVTLVICGRRHMRGLEQRLTGAGVVVSMHYVYDYDGIAECRKKTGLTSSATNGKTRVEPDRLVLIAVDDVAGSASHRVARFRSCLTSRQLEQTAPSSEGQLR